MEVLGEIAEAGGSTSQEYPRDPGPSHPSSWLMPHVIAWEAEHAMKKRHLDQCQYGAPSQKPTTITWKTLRGDGEAPELELRCNCKRHRQTLIGLNKEGGFVSTAAARYPTKLNLAIAKEHLHHAESRGFRNVARGPLTRPLMDETEVEQKKARAPALGEAWRRRNRFREAFKWEWRWTEPSNIVEARTIAIAMQSLARNQKCWSRRVLVATDSLAALAALGKGRSSKEPMKRICRKVTACVQRAAVLQMGSVGLQLGRWAFKANGDQPSQAGQGCGFQREGADAGGRQEARKAHRLKIPRMRSISLMQTSASPPSRTNPA